MGNLFKNLQLIHYDQKTELTGDMTLLFLLKYFRNMSLFSIKHKALSCHHLVFSNIYNPFALWDGCMKISPWVLFEFSQFLFSILKIIFIYSALIQGVSNSSPIPSISPSSHSTSPLPHILSSVSLQKESDYPGISTIME